MKNKIYLLAALGITILLIAFGYFGNCRISKKIAFNQRSETKKSNTNKKVLYKSDTIPSDWKTYTNNQLGLSFQIPSTWVKYGNESNAVNRTGAVMVRMVNFIDTVSKSVFYLEYHLAPYGADLYKYNKAEFDSLNTLNKRETQEVSIAGNKITESFTIMKSDIKGNVYNPPLKFVHVFFLDNQLTGEFNLQFKTTLPLSNVEIPKFDQVISTIKFTN